MRTLNQITRFVFAIATLTVVNCGQIKTNDVSSGQSSSVPDTLYIKAGPFITGSDRAEREYAYQLDEKAYGHQRTREGRWYDFETPRQTVSMDGFRITKTPITNKQYLAFIQATEHPAPTMDSKTWNAYGLIHPYKRTEAFVWKSRAPRKGRENHPVVLVSYKDASAYAEWLSKVSGHHWRLPNELEWEKAARGSDGWYFPWGNTFQPDSLNSHDKGPFDTQPVGFYRGQSPYGLVDAAGQVFEWILTPKKKQAWVKGGSWDDRGCGVCRPAAKHDRDKELRHILIGFRLIRE